MHIAIIGVGAMGSLFAAKLTPFCRITMLGRWQAQRTAVRQNGLTLISPDGSAAQHAIPITDDPAAVPPADLALILVKSYQTARAAAWAAQALSPTGIAVTLQNGVGNREALTTVLGPNRTAQGVTSLGATMSEPGVVRHAGRGPIHLAQTAAAAPHLDAFAALCRRAGLEIHLVENVDSLVWGKLAVNAGINPLTALLRVPNGSLAENARARAIMTAAAKETAVVAAARHISLPYPDAAAQALTVARATAANHSSMLQDILRGAPTEIDAICGAVIEHGRRTNTPTPVNGRLHHLIHTLHPDSPPPDPIETLTDLEAHLNPQSPIRNPQSKKESP